MLVASFILTTGGQYDRHMIDIRGVKLLRQGCQSSRTRFGSYHGQGSSYFNTYQEFYRWVQKGAPTKLGTLVSIEWSEDHQECWWA